MEKQEMDSGLELLKKVIKSNEENIENTIKISFAYEDMLNLVGKFEATAREVAQRVKDLEVKIPKNIEVNLSKESVLRLERFENKSKVLQKLFIRSVISLILAILIMILSFYFSYKWYDESVKTKREIRTQIFKEMRSEGKDFYEKKYVNKLELNTEIINKWMEKNPKEAHKFLIFKDGYEAR